MRAFEDINPFGLFIYFIAVSVLPMFMSDGIVYLISFVCSLTFYLVLNKTEKKSIHMVCFLMFVLLTLINPLISHNGKTVLFVINNSPVTFEALIYGAYSSILIISVIYWCAIFSSIMTSDKILYIFGRFSPKFALVISMTLRYIPMFINQSKNIKNSLKLIGEYKDDNIIDKIKSTIKVFSIMVTWTLENGIITAESMESRGYGTGKRTDYSDYSFCFFDCLFIFLSVFLFVLSFIFINKSSFAFYPEYKIEITNDSLIGYVLYGILALIPTVIETKEIIKWKYSEQKI